MHRHVMDKLNLSHHLMMMGGSLGNYQHMADRGEFYHMPIDMIRHIPVERKIQSIKQVRSITNMGLREAKDFVEKALDELNAHKDIVNEFDTDTVWKAILFKTLEPTIRAYFEFQDQKTLSRECLQSISELYGEKEVMKENKVVYHGSGPETDEEYQQNAEQLLCQLEFALKNATKLGFRDGFEAMQIVLDNIEKNKERHLYLTPVKDDD